MTNDDVPECRIGLMGRLDCSSLIALTHGNHMCDILQFFVYGCYEVSIWPCHMVCISNTPHEIDIYSHMDTIWYKYGDTIWGVPPTNHICLLVHLTTDAIKYKREHRYLICPFIRSPVTLRNDAKTVQDRTIHTIGS